MSSEIARLQDCTPSYWYFERGKTGTDLTLIYNSHATREQAIESTSYVEPDSVVFIEGYAVDSDAQCWYEDDLYRLNTIRFKYGKDSEQYRIVKDMLLEHIEQFEYQPNSPTDFTLYVIQELYELLKKDCVIYYADFRDLSHTGVLEESFSKHNSLFRDSQKYMDIKGLLENVYSMSIAKSVNGFQDSVRGKFIAHGTREIVAANDVLLRMGIINTNDMAGSMRRTSEGKISAYVMYGTAHAKSLTWQFTSRGMEPKVVEMHTLEEHEYMDAANTEGRNNLPRRIGHAAISFLSYNFLDIDAAKQIIRDTYSNLDYLNDADLDELVTFLITCALALRADYKDEDAAFNQYLSILRSFMPNPQEFVPVISEPEETAKL